MDGDDSEFALDTTDVGPKSLLHAFAKFVGIVRARSRATRTRRWSSSFTEDAPQLNPAWLHALTFTANGGRGLYVVPEPDCGLTQAPTEEMVFKKVPTTSPPPLRDLSS